MAHVYKITLTRIDSPSISSGPGGSSVKKEFFASTEEEARKIANSLRKPELRKPVGDTIGEVMYRASIGWDDVHWYEDIKITEHSMDGLSQ